MKKIVSENIIDSIDSKNSTDSKNSNSYDSDTLFLKSSFLRSKSFHNYKDLLSVLLDDDKLYSEKTVHSIINNYLKRSVL